MQTMKRILALLLALLTLFLCACSGGQDQKVVGTCAGYDVLYEELRYVTLTYKKMFESTYGEGIWDDPAVAETYRAELEETVKRIMLNNYAVLAACQAHAITAEDFKSDAIQDAVDAEIAAAEQARDSIAEQAVGLQARVHALQYHAGEAPVEDTTSKEYVAQLEREFAWFEQMFDENWKKTKKRIRKEILWSSKKKTDR